MTEHDPDIEKRINSVALECHKMIDAFLKHLKLQYRLKQIKLFRLSLQRRTKNWILKRRRIYKD